MGTWQLGKGAHYRNIVCFFCFGVLFNERSYLLNISDGMVDMKVF